MAWATPQYSKRRVDDAGRCFVDPGASLEERELALAVINNWRSSHSFPLNTFQVTLRGRAAQVNPDALVAQRIKRLPSIAQKLERFSRMRLSQMQDIGGCRAVVASPVEVEEIARKYRSGSFKHELVREDDYLAAPRKSGYRGIHLVYRYYSDRKRTYEGLLIEVQLRSRLQHAWATAVETVGTFIRQALKSSQGEDEWLRFFALMGSELAYRERRPPVPDTPGSRQEVRAELRPLVKSLDVVNRLQAYGEALRVIEANLDRKDLHYFLLELDAAEQTLHVRAYRSGDLPAASAEYEAIERVASVTEGRDVVLVSAQSLAALRRAFPNYFLDTSEFLQAVRAATRRPQGQGA